MKLIPLTQGKFAMVDDEDFERINQFKWHAHTRRGSGTFYARRNGPYVRGESRSAIFMHREILLCKEDIDHKDHDGLNNQKSNLRVATESQNCKNKKGTGISKYRGVSIQRIKYRKKNGEVVIREKWISYIKTKDKYKCIGTFKTEEEAACAYDKEAKVHHGEFANLNFKDVPTAL